MKIIHIIIIIIGVVAIGIIISVFYSADRYADFEKARLNPEKDFQIIGNFDRTLPINEVDSGFFFFLKDKKGEIAQIFFRGVKPIDFEKSEQIVITCRFYKDFFIASNLLLKCPSKYNQDEVPEKFENLNYSLLNGKIKFCFSNNSFKWTTKFWGKIPLTSIITRAWL